MKWLKRLFVLIAVLIVLVLVAGAVVINPFGPSPFNSFQQDGTLNLPGLEKPVTVTRDENGMAAIRAASMNDLLLAQGFVTAQDRLFQMELTKLFATGRISELAGPMGRGVDIRMRTLGFHRQAQKHLLLLNAETRNFLEKYVAGVNAFITTRPEEIHLEFKAAGIRPTPWAAADCLAILYYMGWGSAANLDDEIVAQALLEKLGPEKAAEIWPLNINPDAEAGTAGLPGPAPVQTAMLGPDTIDSLKDFLRPAPLALGSNNWVAGPAKSKSGLPMLANDPHLEANVLPGPWYPSVLIAPGLRAAGVTIAGVPGMAVGRTEHVAFGITNAYGDAQDLYIETADPKDPNRYLEGDQSFPFDTVTETLRIKDSAAPGGFREEEAAIRFTHRGPVVSNILTGLKTDKVVTLRWSAFEVQEPSIGFEKLIQAQNAGEVREALKHVNQIALNFVFVDSQGHFGWQVSGDIPIRSQGESLLPYVVRDGSDNWTGYIPFDEMPHVMDPERGWVGTCNHMTVRPDYPYYYSSHFSPSYRQRRLIELMDTGDRKTTDEFWEYQRDTLNLMAAKIAPIMAAALAGDGNSKQLAAILKGWDFHDRIEMAAPTVFHAVYDAFAREVFQDELGPDLTSSLLANYYFWQERLQKMVIEGDSPWFDDTSTPNVRETRDDLFRRAAAKALERWKPVLGKDPAKWDWGKAHCQVFVSPLLRSGFGRELLGAGSHPAPGSVETLYRGFYEFNAPYEVTVSASLRMVVDMADKEKVLAVLPGGVRGRQFDPLTSNQVEPFMNGNKVYWWFSDAAIAAHAKTKQTLTP